MTLATLALALTLNGGKVSLIAVDEPVPQVMQAIADRVGGKLELQGDFSRLRITERIEAEEPAAAIRKLLHGLAVDFYVRGRGEVIILQPRDSKPVPQQPLPDKKATEVERAVGFISKLGQLTPEETQRLRQELIRNW